MEGIGFHDSKMKKWIVREKRETFNVDDEGME